jgi:hypothetical protein
MDNARIYRGNPLSPLEFETDDAPSLEMLLSTVEPHWIQVQDLVHDDIEDKVEVTQSLYIRVGKILISNNFINLFDIFLFFTGKYLIKITIFSIYISNVLNMTFTLL